MDTKERSDQLKSELVAVERTESDKNGMIAVEKSREIEILKIAVDAASDALLLKGELVAEEEEVERLASELTSGEE